MLAVLIEFPSTVVGIQGLDKYESIPSADTRRHLGRMTPSGRLECFNADFEVCHGAGKVRVSGFELIEVGAKGTHLPKTCRYLHLNRNADIVGDAG